MRNVVARIFDYSPAGRIAVEGSEFFDFCRELPDDQAQIDQTLSLYEHADLHIVGRKTYEGMSSYFPTAQDHPYADVMNAAPKVVFSSTLSSASWTNTIISNGDLASEIAALRQGGDGDIVAHGGLSFWQSLARLDLIDSYRLTVFPFLAGDGGQLFADLGKSHPLELVSATPFSNGTVELHYRRAH
jgi:dihydrofolate reductase